MPIHYPTVSIRITHGRQFRALVQEDEGVPPYEITVGGEDWVNRRKTSLKARKKIKTLATEYFEKLKAQYETYINIDGLPKIPLNSALEIKRFWDKE